MGRDGRGVGRAGADTVIVTVLGGHVDQVLHQQRLLCMLSAVTLAILDDNDIENNERKKKAQHSPYSSSRSCPESRSGTRSASHGLRCSQSDHFSLMVSLSSRTPLLFFSLAVVWLHMVASKEWASWKSKLSSQEGRQSQCRSGVLCGTLADREFEHITQCTGAN